MSNCCIFQPESIEEKRGILTITLADGVLSTLCADEMFGVSLKTSIPNEVRCARVVVTDGTTSKNVAKCNQYYRPETLPCGCIMWLCNKTDPETVAVFCRYGKQKGC